MLNNFKARSGWSGAIALAALAHFAPAGAQTDYIYGLGNASVGSQIGMIYQFALNNTPATPTITTTTLFNTVPYLQGWGTAGRNDQFVNGLALDTANGNLYFNYSWSQGTGSSARQYFELYTMKSVGGILQNPQRIASYQGNTQWNTTSTSGESRLLDNGYLLPRNDVVNGYVPRAGWQPSGSSEYAGIYWAGFQVSDDLIGIAINSAGTTTVWERGWDDFDDTTTTSIGGSDLVISSSTIYGTADISSQNNFYRQTLAQATNGAAGGDWTLVNVNASVPFTTYGAIQVAGLGSIPRMYGITQHAGGNSAWRINDYATAPTFTQFTVIGTIPGVADLTEGMFTPLQVPEAGTLGAGVVTGGLIGWGVLARRRRPGQLPLT